MTLREKLTQNNLLTKVENGDMVASKRVWHPDKYDAIVSNGYGLGGESLFLKRLDDLDVDISEFENDIYIIKVESWKDMTTSNLFLKDND